MSAPVLLLGFNRLETFKQTLPALRAAAPQRVYIACDGPRTAEEKLQTDAVRAFLQENIDWTDDRHFLLRDENLGCGQAVSQALTWFFKHEEMGIILEDDCLPHADFFSFCNRNLERYHDDTRVSMIGGTNYLGRLPSEYPYEGFFSQYYPIWGWASWRRAWQMYDFDMAAWPVQRKAKLLQQLLPERSKWKLYQNLFDHVAKGKIDTWDVQWVYTQLMQNSLALIPAVNLVSNIGFQGTHDSKKSPYLNMPAFPLNRVADLPPQMHPHFEYDAKIFNRITRNV